MGLRIFPCLLCLLLPACTASMLSDTKTATDPLSGLIRFYEGPLDHLASVRGGECPMHPSCSAYTKEALEKHGFFLGWMMASDRLLRCGRDETKLAPPVFVDGTWKAYDPLEANVAWWATKEARVSALKADQASGPESLNWLRQVSRQEAQSAGSEFSAEQ